MKVKAIVYNVGGIRYCVAMDKIWVGALQSNRLDLIPEGDLMYY